ncbi:MAG TPA: RNA 2',3'-cyclic phosphodiesterase [Nevskiaceae bacterium]|nr:RNA 2',3'-cyclic phosphodiesterase [Nevskiaceae bacterium]
MRAFVSLELPLAVKKEIGEIQQKLKATGLQARWVKSEIVHLTIAFLGSATPNKLDIVSNILKEVANQTKTPPARRPGKSSSVAVLVASGDRRPPTGGLAAVGVKPIKLKLSQLGCFPHPKKARIIFIELCGELAKLNTVAIKIRKQLKKQNVWFDKKPFSAHLTLARIKKKQNLTSLVKKIKIKQVEFTSSQLTLTKSQLTATGPIYTQIKTIALTTQPEPS